jgi:hypothetical protein
LIEVPEECAHVKVNIELFIQLEDLYRVKSRHLGFLNSVLAGDWKEDIQRERGDIWEQKGERFYLGFQKDIPKPLRLLVPTKRQILIWTMIGFANEVILEVGPDSLGDFLQGHIDNPVARINLEEIFLGMDINGPGLKAYGSIAVCAQEENRFIDRYLPMLRAFAANDPRALGIDGKDREAADGFLREIDDFRRYLDSDVLLFRKFKRDLKELFRGNILL